MGKGRVRDALVLFHALGLIELDEAAKTFQAADRLIEWSHAGPEGRLQQLAVRLEAYRTRPESTTPGTPPAVETQVASSVEPRAEQTSEERTLEERTPEEPAPAPRPTVTSRFGRGTGRQPVRVTANAKSDEELMAELEPQTRETPTVSAPPAGVLRPAPRRAPAVTQSNNPPISQEPAEQPERRRWGRGPSSGATPNASALRRPAGGRVEQEAEMMPDTARLVGDPGNSTDGIVNLPTFFRLLSELNDRAERLRQAGLTDDPNIKIDLLQLIQKIQESR
jgi:hypothetical protein